MVSIPLLSCGKFIEALATVLSAVKSASLSACAAIAANCCAHAFGYGTVSAHELALSVATAMAA
jgi:hypothetical protein